jgi:hypothetical protein
MGKVPILCETYNVWCDRMGQKTWDEDASSHFDPDVLPIITFSVFSRYPTFHKLTGCFDNGIYYLHKKHNLSFAKMDKVNVIALQSYLTSLKSHKCSSIVKMIHNWTL